MKYTYVQYSYVTYRDRYCMYKYVVYLGDLNKLNKLDIRNSNWRKDTNWF